MFILYKCSEQILVIGLEKNKLFVKDLSRDTTREHLEQVFSEYGTLKEVRLITYRNGHSKGLAFVEFEDEASAAKALVKTDGKMIQQFLIELRDLFGQMIFNHFVCSLFIL